ncbi:hypothetical protein QAD02_022256 [Eretmocerus hayati]|uniref:Uncharacterized protein n=1 Tax=Eretmocerus hayati TaxID=131215 RepID=A0ACC2PSS1_9HYME|nr:hypothetical protein QAD02_022256 [Eretmocerus hayati]
MPKDYGDRGRYYREDMSDPGRPMSRDRARGRSSAHQQERRDDRSRSSSQQGARRPGEPYPEPAHGASPYPRQSSGSGRESLPSSARGEHVRTEHRPQSVLSETASDTASVTGSTHGREPSGAVGRGSMRGRRVLPVDIITRPRDLQTKQGSHGRPIELRANYFKLLSTTDWCLNKYRVDIEPEEDRNVIRKGLLRSHRETLGAYIFDGSLLWTSNRLPEDGLELTSERQHDKQVMLIKIKPVGQMNRGDYECLQFFNIIMRKCLDYLELRLVGRNYFDAKSKVLVRDFKLELWPGYVTSIRQHEQNILMCAEITHKVMRDETLLDVLAECYQSNRHDYQKIFADQVIGCVVLTGYNNNTYRIDDVDFNVSPNSTFTRKDGSEIKYYDYYLNRYQIKIQDLRQPMLVSKSKPRDRRAGQAELVYLVPELCRSTGLTDAMRSDFRLMKALAEHTRVSPRDRVQKLMLFNSRLQSVPNVTKELSDWNLKLDTQLVTIPARQLPADKILYGNGASNEVPANASWNNDFRNKALKKAGKLDEWVVVYPNRNRRETEAFVNMLMRVGSGMHFQIDMPVTFELSDDSAASYASKLEEIKANMNPMLIFCVVSNNRMDRYSAIKKKCCVDRPVPTQVVVAKTLNAKSVMSVATKVAIQMNCKIGGVAWTVSIPLTGLMVVGFDVCHDTNQKNKDFGAMVASIDVNFGRYYSAVSSHTSGEELSSDLSVNLCKALDQFKRYNNALPKRIVIYRDGVGDGQIPYVVKHEVTQLKAKLETVYDNPEDIKLAYIIVTKKINTRLFCGDPRNSQNPPPGTVVDDVITDPSKYDFFIVSQHVTQGTVSPTSYNVVEDTSGLDVDKIQRLTYKLCHMYFNWTGTVRVPAPCQYAHKLAFLVSQAIHQPPSSTLETLLYFL